ncbi:Golgi-associated plant pathogenesis-related protein 1-like [Physella acuta]|uniref:Golgi-associated plant pathogenesis-related protein 1-like n=1 Tax=Physella acuta TaxID=109671 RepID=UPI0027DCEE66|nr:Golgi-associated plant pathogenesis-related protein 1-like [Physella acuta]
MGCGSSKTAHYDTRSDTKGVKSLGTFRKEALTAHNILRKQHGAEPIKLSEELNTMAQKWAEYLAEHQVFIHSPEEHRIGAGENLAGHSDVISGQQLVDMWYSEIKGNNISHPDFKKGIGHVTQVVWNDCTHVGFGRSTKPGMNGMYMYVANYRPGGSWFVDFNTRPLPQRR